MLNVITNFQSVLQLFSDKRKCRFPDEADNLKLFKSYSQTACTFECRLLNAHKFCQCYPWNIPAEPKDGLRHTICDVFGNYCFKHVMNMKDTWHKCKCLPTCDQIEFTVGEQAFPRDPDEICKKTVTDLSLEYNLASKVVEK